MRQALATVYRFSIIAGTLLPMYLYYVFLWYRRKWLGIRTTREKWRATHRKYAKRFYRMAVKLKGGMIKVGQLISARVDVMPREWIEELSLLQDSVPPTPWPYIHKTLKAELGGEPDGIFEWIDHNALAAASFGQVHRARTKEGEEVVLKIQHEDIEFKLKVDLWMLRTAVKMFNIFIPRTDLSVIGREMSHALSNELSYEQEAAYCETIGNNFAGFTGGVVIPRVIRKYTTRHVICMEFFDGYKITNFAKMKELEIDRRETLTMILNAWTKMMYQDGVFQSDPHPGNLMFNKIGGKVVVCVLDFGQVKILPKEFHQKLLAAVFAFLSRDVNQFLPALKGLGVLGDADLEAVRPILSEFFQHYFHLSPQEAKNLDFRKIREDVLATIEKIDRITIPNDIILYGRTFSLLSGLATQIDKTANMFLIAKPFIMQTLMTMNAPAAQPAAPAAAAPAS
ncbi:MAG: AarF/ABC1/UbiB kinase family protein [Deltaproteobacteria bacterium]|nr:AarF/ABC1/UbiB kinase family protein [Deltaproteobacteria bacterium]